jgi:hypothetical protein
MKPRKTCGAFARSTGQPCRARAMLNGRCRNHGGLSTGPTTPEGRRAVGSATSQRMRTGQREKALEGLRRWLEDGGKEMLSKLAALRQERRRDQRVDAQFSGG